MAARIRPTALDHRQFFQYINHTIQDVNRMIQESNSQETLDSAIFRIESALVNLMRLNQDISQDDVQQYEFLCNDIQVHFNIIIIIIQPSIIKGTPFF